MIDLHCHILPGIDDGPETLDEALQMCHLSYQDGIRVIVATPHLLNGLYQSSPETILSRVQELNMALSSPSQPSIRVLPGADVHFSEDLPKAVEEGRILTVGQGGRFLFLEFPFQWIPYKAEEVLFHLLGKGITPIITHPERNLEVLKNPKKYYEMVRMGCLGQVTAMSLTGEFGSGVKGVAEKLLKHRLIHLIASDGHSIHRRPPVLSSALRRAEKMVGKEEAYRMVTAYPQAILEGKKPDVPDPLPV